MNKNNNNCNSLKPCNKGIIVKILRYLKDVNISVPLLYVLNIFVFERVDTFAGSYFHR